MADHLHKGDALLLRARSTTPAFSRRIQATFNSLPRLGPAPAKRATTRVGRERDSAQRTLFSPDVSNVGPSAAVEPPASEFLLAVGDPDETSGGALAVSAIPRRQRPDTSGDLSFEAEFAQHRAARGRGVLSRLAASAGADDNTALNTTGGGGAKPDFVLQLEDRLDRELRLLQRAQGGGSDRERMMVFQDVAAQIVPCFRHYGPLLSRCFHEYDAQVAAGALHGQRLLAAEAELHEARRAAAHEVLTLRRQVGEWEQTTAARHAAARDRVASERSSVEELLEALDGVERRLTEERQMRVDAEQQALHSKAMSFEFERALRGMEDNYAAIIDDKDMRISAALLELKDVSTTLGGERQTCRIERQTLADKVEALQIALAVRERREQLLLDRVRHLESNVMILSVKHTDLHADFVAAEEKLEQLNKGSAAMRIRDPAMTPRPNRQQLVEEVPALGSAQFYNSTEALVRALVEQLRCANERAVDGDRTVAMVEATVAERIAQRSRVFATAGCQTEEEPGS
jgi:hypothetical protein